MLEKVVQNAAESKTERNKLSGGVLIKAPSVA